MVGGEQGRLQRRREDRIVCSIYTSGMLAAIISVVSCSPVMTSRQTLLTLLSYLGILPQRCAYIHSLIHRWVQGKNLARDELHLKDDML